MHQTKQITELSETIALIICEMITFQKKTALIICKWSLSKKTALIICKWPHFLKSQRWSLWNDHAFWKCNLDHCEKVKHKNVCYQLLKLYGKYCTNGNWQSAKRMHLQSLHLSKISHHDSFKCDTLVSIWCLANEVQTNSLNKRCRHCFSFTLELLMQIYQCSWSNWSSRSNVPNEQRPKSYLKLLYLEGCQRHLLLQRNSLWVFLWRDFSLPHNCCTIATLL